MEANLSENTRKAVAFSRDEAIRLKNGSIGVEHLFLGLTRLPDCSALTMLSALGVNTSAIKENIEKHVGQTEAEVRYADDSEIPMLRQTEKVLRLSYLESIKMKAKEIKTEHLVLAILQEGDSLVAQQLGKAGVSYDRFAKVVRAEGPATEPTELPDFSMQTSEDDNDDPFDDPTRADERSKVKGEKGKKDTPALDNFGRDLTKLAREGKLDPIVGRSKEMDRIAQILSRRKKNNP
ncbi:MAG: ATP-dependent Clp protease ATP-binding subunit, partial [Bacteroidales bacterium]|nr:ATP-dependent Clp protease ATP-binding subunit [Bacteroidales bacterium]